MATYQKIDAHNVKVVTTEVVSPTLTITREETKKLNDVKSRKAQLEAQIAEWTDRYTRQKQAEIDKCDRELGEKMAPLTAELAIITEAETNAEALGVTVEIPPVVEEVVEEVIL